MSFCDGCSSIFRRLKQAGSKRDNRTNAAAQSGKGHTLNSEWHIRTYGPRQANLVLIAYASSEGSGEPAHPRSLARTFAARSYKQWIKRNRLTESQIPGPSEWLGMRSWNLSWRNARRHKFAWRGSYGLNVVRCAYYEQDDHVIETEQHGKLSRNIIWKRRFHVRIESISRERGAVCFTTRYVKSFVRNQLSLLSLFSAAG